MKVDRGSALGWTILGLKFLQQVAPLELPGRGWPDDPSGVGISDRRKEVSMVLLGIVQFYSVTFNVKFMSYIFVVPCLLLKVDSWSLDAARCPFGIAHGGGPPVSCQ